MGQQDDEGLTFFQQDYTPANLTNWGWNLIQSDPEIAGGGVVHNLLMRALPSHYRGNSVYAMFPFTHPDRTKDILTKLKKDDDYDFSTPSFKHHPISVRTYDAVTAILRDQSSFKVPCEY